MPSISESKNALLKLAAKRSQIIVFEEAILQYPHMNRVINWINENIIKYPRFEPELMNGILQVSAMIPYKILKSQGKNMNVYAS